MDVVSPNLYFNALTEYFLAQGLSEGANGPEYDALMREFGGVLRDRAIRKPEAMPHLQEFIGVEDPIIIAHAALMPIIGGRLLDQPAEWFKDIADQIKNTADAVADAAEAAAEESENAPEEALEQAEWRISLYLQRIKCIKETSGFLGTEAGKDDIKFTGAYSYGEGGSKPLHYNYSGLFDTGESIPANASERLNLLIAYEVIPESQDFTNFTAILLMLEDDGMSASAAAALSKIIGGIATIITNLLLTTVQVQTGVTIPPNLKEAYDNYGLPGLIGVLAKAFGPEAFVPIAVRCRTKLQPDSSTALPVWRGRIPDPGGDLTSGRGSGDFEGTITLYEGETEEVELPNGTEVYSLTADLDEGKYEVLLKFEITQS